LAPKDPYPLITRKILPRKLPSIGIAIPIEVEGPSVRFPSLRSPGSAGQIIRYSESRINSSRPGKA